jgi:hypothetical protein
MGPPLERGGWSWRRSGIQPFAMLQWGRPWRGADGATSSRTRTASSACFNGAAPGEGRMASPKSFPAPASVVLQWGRPWRGADGWHAVERVDAEAVASMGPPLERGGWRRRPRNRRSPIVSLQWGRPWRGADGRGTRGRRDVNHPLQWGRPWRGADGATTRFHVLVVGSASMGPPLERGGWGRDVEASWRRRRRFNVDFGCRRQDHVRGRVGGMGRAERRPWRVILGNLETAPPFPHGEKLDWRRRHSRWRAIGEPGSRWSTRRRPEHEMRPGARIKSRRRHGVRQDAAMENISLA